MEIIEILKNNFDKEHKIITCYNTQTEEISTVTIKDILDIFYSHEIMIASLEKSNRNWRRKCQRLRRKI